MKLQLWRNATLVLTVDNLNILIDPMLGGKGALGAFPMTDNDLLNPLVDLPFSDQELAKKLSNIDAVAVSHLHPDHWDAKAIELLDKNIPVICPESIASQITQQGFTNTIAIHDHIMWKGISISLTNGLHGTGEIGEKMGTVNGFVFKKAENSVYVIGDSIWYDRIAYEIDEHQPQHIIAAGEAATFSVGDPIIMTSEDLIKLCQHAPKAIVWVTHLEAVSHCKENRNFIKEKIDEQHLEKRCIVLEDGEEVPLLF